MTTPLFERHGDRYAATHLTTGPWSADHLHGGATSALLAHLLEEVPAPVPMRSVRLTVELLRPVTRTPVHADLVVHREGRRIQSVRAALLDESDVEVANATVLRVRTEPDVVPSTDDEDLPAGLAPLPDDLPRFSGDDVWQAGFFEAVNLRLPEGALGRPGSAAGWARLEVPVVADEPVHGLSRLAAAADFGNGISAPLPMDRYVFINPDLTVAIDRLPIDGWVGIASRSVTQDDGIGRTVTELADRRGRIGTGLQNLYVAPR